MSTHTEGIQFGHCVDRLTDRPPARPSARLLSGVGWGRGGREGGVFLSKDGNAVGDVRGRAPFTHIYLIFFSQRIRVPELEKCLRVVVCLSWMIGEPLHTVTACSINGALVNFAPRSLGRCTMKIASVLRGTCIWLVIYKLTRSRAGYRVQSVRGLPVLLALLWAQKRKI